MRCYPLARSVPVSSGYGMRGPEFHHGIDFACPVGTPIYAAADGVVIEGADRRNVDGFGSWIWIDCQASAGVDLIYGHVHHPGIRVAAGHRVRAGDLIGVSGNEGVTTGPHLHFEVWGPPGRVGGRSQDPEPWLRDARDPTTLTPPPKGSDMAIHTTGDPVWLPGVLRAAGLTCDELSGAMDRGHGDFGSIWGIIAHHTGSNPPANNPWYIAQHPQLGLASQLHLSRSGKFTLCGVGVAWHAGNGAWSGIARNNANAVTIGIEAENNGTEGWSKAQYNAYVVGVAAILNKLGRDSSRVIGHKEWAGPAQGKWDPGGIDMAAFRRDVATAQAKLKAGTHPAPQPVPNLIDAEAKVAAAWIGKRITDGELPVGTDGKGRCAVFENGTVYWHPDVHRANGNAVAVPTRLLETLNSHGGLTGFLGYPTRRHVVLNGWDIQAFQGGTLYRKAGAAQGFPVRGVIGRRWAAEGFETGPLGGPISDEYAYAGGDGDIRQDFEHGHLLFSTTGTPKVVLS